MCTTEAGTGGPLYVVVFANDQSSAPFKTKDVNNDGILEDDGDSMYYKRPQITPNNYVSNDDNSLPAYFASTDGADPAVTVSAIHTGLGNPGRKVDIMIRVCGEECEADNGSDDGDVGSDDSNDDGTETTDPVANERCCYVATESGDADAFDNDDDESGDSSEVQQQTDLTYRVPALTSVRDVTRRASVNFTLQVAVTSTTYGEIGTSTPAPFHRGLIFYKLPVSDPFVQVVFEGDKALIIVSGSDFGGGQDVGGYEVCGTVGESPNTVGKCNRMLGKAQTFTSGGSVGGTGLTNFAVDSWSHSLVTFRVNRAECCPGSVQLYVGNQETLKINFPGQSPKLAMTQDEITTIQSNQNELGVSEYYATKGGDTITGIKVKHMTDVNLVKIVVGGVEATILTKEINNQVACTAANSVVECIYEYSITVPEGQGTDVELQVVNTNGGESGSDTMSIRYRVPSLVKIKLVLDSTIIATTNNAVNYMSQAGIPSAGAFIQLEGNNFGKEGYVRWCLQQKQDDNCIANDQRHTVDCCQKWENPKQLPFAQLDQTTEGSEYGHEVIKVGVCYLLQEVLTFCIQPCHHC